MEKKNEGKNTMISKRLLNIEKNLHDIGFKDKNFIALFKNVKGESNKEIKFTKKFNYFGTNRLFFIYLLFIIIVLLLLKESISDTLILQFYLVKSYEIMIKINGTGPQNILSNSYNNRPDNIYLNEQLINTSDYHIINIPTQENQINNVTLIWQNSGTSIDRMFFGLENIVEVDFSKYDTSLIISMNEVFLNCTSITSINLSNINTISVQSIC